MVHLLGGGGSSSGSGSGSQIQSASPRHSIHGSGLSSSQASSHYLAPTGESIGKTPRLSSGASSGARSITSDVKSDFNESTASLPAVSQNPNNLPPTHFTPKGGSKSVEETVKIFRLYEALRSGDTAFISKTLRETADKNSTETVSPSVRSQILHLAIQCSELPVIEYILLHTSPTPQPSVSLPFLDINTRDKTTGNTPLHVAAQLARQDVITVLLAQPTINDAIQNFQGKTALDLARSPGIFEKFELAKSVFVENATKLLLELIARRDYSETERLLDSDRVKGWLDVNSIDITPSDYNPSTERPYSNSSKETSKRLSKLAGKEGQSSGVDMASGSTLLHEAARNKDTKLIEILLLHGADPFRRDKRGKLPQDITKDEKVKAVLKKSPAAAHAQRGIEEKAILGGAQGTVGLESIGEQGREMKGYLKKWTNYTGGWKLRWFVLEDGVLSYYKHQGGIYKVVEILSTDFLIRRHWICVPWRYQHENC